MTAAIILLVEGKNAGNSSFAAALRKAEYNVRVVHTGTTALKDIEETLPDLIVFDSSSMRSSGVRICRRLRRAVGEKPIIHLREANVPKDETAEADVYLQQPFTSRKLLNRVRVLLPADDANEEVIRFGAITLYRTKRSVDVNGQGERPLTPKLAQLLEEFIRHPNQIISRRQLMQNVWKTDYIGDTRTLDVHIRWMRECIEKDPANPELLRTIRGKGYALSIPPKKKESK